MGQMEQQPGSGNQNERLLLARNMSQIEIAYLKGEDYIGWVGRYAGKFNELTKEDPYLLENLAEPGTHTAAIERIIDKLYPPETIH